MNKSTIRINKVYTRNGDDGKTKLGDGTEVAKNHLRVQCYGTVEEANVWIGSCHLALTDIQFGKKVKFLIEQFSSIQQDLFDLGGDLCAIPKYGEPDKYKNRIDRDYWDRLESWMDELNEELPPLESFIIPGGISPFYDAVNHARVVVRRAEREFWPLMESGVEHRLTDRALSGTGAPFYTVNVEVGRYLNRLSDYLFVIGRWVPHTLEQKLSSWDPGSGHELNMHGF